MDPQRILTLPNDAAPGKMASYTVTSRKRKRPSACARGESVCWDPVKSDYFGILCFVVFV